MAEVFIRQQLQQQQQQHNYLSPSLVPPSYVVPSSVKSQMQTMMFQSQLSSQPSTETTNYFNNLNNADSRTASAPSRRPQEYYGDQHHHQHIQPLLHPIPNHQYDFDPAYNHFKSIVNAPSNNNSNIISPLQPLTRQQIQRQQNNSQTITQKKMESRDSAFLAEANSNNNLPQQKDQKREATPTNGINNNNVSNDDSINNGGNERNKPTLITKSNSTMNANSRDNTDSDDKNGQIKKQQSVQSGQNNGTNNDNNNNITNINRKIVEKDVYDVKSPTNYSTVTEQPISPYQEQANVDFNKLGSSSNSYSLPQKIQNPTTNDGPPNRDYIGKNRARIPSPFAASKQHPFLAYSKGDRSDNEIDINRQSLAYASDINKMNDETLKMMAMVSNNPNNVNNKNNLTLISSSSLSYNNSGGYLTSSSNNNSTFANNTDNSIKYTGNESCCSPRALLLPTSNNYSNGENSEDRTVRAVQTNNSGVSNSAVQHLMKQITFLHSEVERLEKELSDTRRGYAEGSKPPVRVQSPSAASSGGGNTAGINTKGQRLGSRSTSPFSTATVTQMSAEVTSLSRSCKKLESQLAAALAEKSAVAMERNDLLARVRKLEGVVKVKKATLSEVQEDITAVNASSAAKVQKLQAQITEMSKSYAVVKRALEGKSAELTKRDEEKAAAAKRMVESFVQCPERGAYGSAFTGSDSVTQKGEETESETVINTVTVVKDAGVMADLKPIKHDAMCQVALIRGILPLDPLGAMEGLTDAGGNLVGLGDPSSSLSKNTAMNGDVRLYIEQQMQQDSYVSLAHMLQVRCTELDTARSDLHRLTEIHKETLHFVEETKRRLSEEMEARKRVESDNESLSLQIRALQQQTALLSAQIRDKDAVVTDLQRQAQEAVATALRLERERSEWENELRTNSKDMQNLVANQNFVHQQLEQLGNENDELRGEVHRLLQLESQHHLAIRAKDSELGEVLQAYQQAIREGEGNLGQYKALATEAENLRAALAVKEERLVAAQETISQLHAREQQLSIDLQNFDYEGSTLHHKLLQSENTVARLNSQVYDLQQHQLAQERVYHELERNVSELSKQLVLKDNENMNLRTRCDLLEQECAALHTARNTETSRLRELEDLNAKMAVQNILTKQTEQRREELDLGRVQKELNEAKVAIINNTKTISSLNEAIETEKKRSEELSQKLNKVELRSKEAEAAKERMQKLVEEQAVMLTRV